LIKVTKELLSYRRSIKILVPKVTEKNKAQYFG